MSTASALVRRASIAGAAAIALISGNVIPAQAVESGECTITAKADMGETYIGGNTATWNCNKAKKVTVKLEAGVLIAGSYQWKYWYGGPWATLNGKGSHKLAISAEGSSELVVWSTICYQWGTSTTKCRTASDSRKF